MKRLVAILSIMVLAVVAMAQVPQTMNFQALIRNAENQVVTNQSVEIEVSVLNSAQQAVYTETHSVTTNFNGIATLEVGAGTPVNGTFAGIDWSADRYYMETKIQLSDGSDAISDVTPLLSVPYALYATKSGSTDIDLSDYALKSEIPAAVDLTDYALKSEIPAEVDLTDYAKSADVESAYAKKTALNEYAKSGANISIFVNDVEYVKKSYVDSLFNVLKTQIATISNGGGNGGEDGQHENGRINAKFSISADKQVYFSQGNLQYQASTKTWRFAENQYDLIGDDNENISSTYDGWIDLFGFGTSGYGDSHPYNSGEYDSYPNSYSIGLISETNYDWGYYNSISNGGGESGLWRTLTGEEWNYLFSSRTNAANLYGAAQVNGVNGVVILPDAWTLPDGVSFTKGFSATLLYELNTYTTTDWEKMEANGAVFLPAVGYRLTTTVNDAGVDGYYWSSIENKAVQFSGEALRTDYQWKRSNGYGVRAVQDVDKNSATEENNEGGSSDGEQGSNTEENPSGENTGNENEGGGSNENEEGETGESSSGTDENLDYEVTEYGRLYTTGLVDLGLSVKWAACNLGATSPDGYGDYYAWGETETKESYASDNSTTFDKSLSELRSAGIIDANNNLTANYDVAIKKLGTGYRMPTMEEQRDLLDNCTFVWGSYKGVNGCYIEGKNGNCIFLPATGRLFNTSSGDVGTCGNYWSSNVYEENSAYGLFFNSSLHFFSTDYQRFEGVCIRAVQDDDGENSTIEENNEGETGSDGEQGSNTEENPSGENTGNENEGGSQGGGSNENEDGETAESGSGTEETLDYEVTEYGKLYTTGMVDLGLSVKWAACNIGATSPDSYGDYYAWGETETKDSYDLDNSTTYDKKLSELRSAGIIDANNNLTANYDVATQKLGAGYRMPTTDEMQELVQNCTWVLSTCKGVSGYYVEGKNGNCIFLPEAGWFSATFGVEVGTYGNYWCSTADNTNPKEDAASLVLLSNGYFFISRYDRYVGYSVRAVQDAE
ncbi:MAG: hypothetical protein MJ204_04935 [Bacteroidales bacterium]|nr:hypothetical protein [Bacteroidales bacterium]